MAFPCVRDFSLKRFAASRRVVRPSLRGGRGGWTRLWDLLEGSWDCRVGYCGVGLIKRIDVRRWLGKYYWHCWHRARRGCESKGA